MTGRCGIMPYITEADRGQLQLFAMDDLVAKDSPARVIDVFVESLDLKALGFTDTGVSFEGRPAYRPQALLKLLLYGNGNRLRSSRLLQKACGVNIEVMWMLGGLTPDFRTISDFRKDNIKCLKKVFHEFNARVGKLLPHGALSVDGSKFRACNSKDNNFTAAKLQDRIDWLNRHSDEYLRQLDELDALDDENEHCGRFTREELEEKILATSERLERYLSYQRQMEQSGQGQLSLVDPEAKLMKSKDGLLVGFNVQTAVDTESHLIEDFNVTTNCTDHGEIYSTLSEIRRNTEGVIDSIEDKGYFQADDMMKCLENGIVPHVIPSDGKDTYELETSFEEAVCTPEELASSQPHDLAKCLRAGIKPEALGGVIDSIEVVEKRCRFTTSLPKDLQPARTPKCVSAPPKGISCVTPKKMLCIAPPEAAFSARQSSKTDISDTRTSLPASAARTATAAFRQRAIRTGGKLISARTASKNQAIAGSKALQTMTPCPRLREGERISKPKPLSASFFAQTGNSWTNASAPPSIRSGQ